MAFTPDGDGLNDNFIPVGKFIRTFLLQIFDKWGNLIFTSNDQTTGWDGTINGEKAPTGAYVYKAEIEDFAGRVISKSGSIILLR